MIISTIAICFLCVAAAMFYLAAKDISTSNHRVWESGEAAAETLKSIDARLAKIEETSKKLDRCMDSNNHQHQMCVRTGHWNGSGK